MLKICNIKKNFLENVIIELLLITFEFPLITLAIVIV